MIRLAVILAILLIDSQFVIPPLAERHVADRLTDHGGSANVTIRAFPALKLLFGRGGRLGIDAHSLSVDLGPGQQDVFSRLDEFSDVSVTIAKSRAGPFSIAGFHLERLRAHVYVLTIRGDATAGDVARYAGARLGGQFGQDLAGLAAAALGDFDRPVPFNARMRIDTSTGTPHAQNVVGNVAGFPAGPLAEVVANALLGGL